MSGCESSCGTSSCREDSNGSASHSSFDSSITFEEHGIPIQFPFQPYPAQRQMISKMIEAFENGQNAILESPTGSGKSLAILCAALAWRKYKLDNLSTTAEKESEFPSDQEDLSWMGTDIDVFKLLLAQMKFQAAFALYEKRKKDMPPKNIPKDDTKWKPTKEDDIPKIYVTSRTHRQIAQLIKELKGNTSYRPRISVLGSRKQYCIKDQIKNSDNVDEECGKELEYKICEPYKNVSALEDNEQIAPGGEHEIWDIEDLVTIGRKTDSCPYFAARAIAAKAELIFCPYNYIIDPAIRDIMNIDLKNSIVIIDEAHNIESASRDAATFETHTGIIDLIQIELAQLITLRHLIQANSTMLDFLNLIKNWINNSDFRFSDGEKDNRLAQCFTGDAMIRELQKMTIDRDSFTTKYKPAHDAIVRHFEHQNSSEKNAEAVQVEEVQPDGSIVIKSIVPNRKTVSSRSIRVLKRLFLILGFIFKPEKKYKNDYTLALLKKKQTVRRSDTNIDLCFWCMNPGVIFNAISQKAHSVILTSGTLSPMETFSSELQTEFPIQLVADHVIDKSQVWVKTIASGPTNYAMTGTFAYAKTPQYLQEVSMSICQAALNIPYGILCFLPSYSAIRSLHDYIMSQEAIRNTILSKKKIFVEPQNKPTSEFDNLLNEYYDCIENTGSGINGALFFAVYRGKVSEGIDFSDNYCRGVICIGLPLPNFHDKLIRLKREHNDKKRNMVSSVERAKLLSGNDWYQFQAYRALNQALGRCIRHKNDWGAIILLESRFAELRHSRRLSKWVAPLLTNSSNNFTAIMNELQQFVKYHHTGDMNMNNSQSIIYIDMEDEDMFRPSLDLDSPKDLMTVESDIAYKKMVESLKKVKVAEVKCEIDLTTGISPSSLEPDHCKDVLDTTPIRRSPSPTPKGITVNNLVVILKGQDEFAAAPLPTKDRGKYSADYNMASPRRGRSTTSDDVFVNNLLVISEDEDESAILPLLTKNKGKYATGLDMIPPHLSSSSSIHRRNAAILRRVDKGKSRQTSIQSTSTSMVRPSKKVKIEEPLNPATYRLPSSFLPQDSSDGGGFFTLYHAKGNKLAVGSEGTVAIKKESIKMKKEELLSIPRIPAYMPKTSAQTPKVPVQQPKAPAPIQALPLAPVKRGRKPKSALAQSMANNAMRLMIPQPPLQQLMPPPGPQMSSANPDHPPVPQQQVRPVQQYLRPPPVPAKRTVPRPPLPPPQVAGPSTALAKHKTLIERLRQRRILEQQNATKSAEERMRGIVLKQQEANRAAIKRQEEHAEEEALRKAAEKERARITKEKLDAACKATAADRAMQQEIAPLENGWFDWDSPNSLGKKRKGRAMMNEEVDNLNFLINGPSKKRATTTTTVQRSVASSSKHPPVSVPALAPAPVLSPKPKYKSDLDFAGQNLSFTRVKTEVSSNGSSASAKSDDDDDDDDCAVIEFFETAHGLVMPKRHRKKNSL